MAIKFKFRRITGKRELNFKQNNFSQRTKRKKGLKDINPYGNFAAFFLCEKLAKGNATVEELWVIKNSFFCKCLRHICKKIPNP